MQRALSLSLSNENVLPHEASVFYIHRAPKGGAVTLEILLLSLRLLREGREEEERRGGGPDIK